MKTTEQTGNLKTKNFL